MGRGDWWANPDRNLDDGSICDQPPSRASRIAPCCGTTRLTRPHSTTVRHGICDHKIQERLLALGPRIKQMPRPHSSEASSVAARQGKAHRCCDRQQRRSCRRRDCMGRGDWWANPDRNLDDGSVCDQPPSHASRIADVFCSGPCRGNANPHNKTVRQDGATKVGNCTCLTGKPKQPGVFLKHRPMGCARRSMAHPYCDRPKRRSCGGRDCRGRGDRWANPARSLDDGSVCDQPPPAMHLASHPVAARLD